MVKRDNDRDDSAAQHLDIVNNIFCECLDNNGNKVKKMISIRFLLAIEFRCASCMKLVLVKAENPEEKIVCPACQQCEFMLADIFNKLLTTAKRPTPHRRPSRRDMNDKQNNKAGRPTLDGVHREYIQLTLHPDTLDTLYELNTNRGAIIEFLLNLFPPFTSILENKKRSNPPDTSPST